MQFYRSSDNSRGAVLPSRFLYQKRSAIHITGVAVSSQAAVS